jgi:hypothetical protein
MINHDYVTSWRETRDLTLCGPASSHPPLDETMQAQAA